MSRGISPAIVHVNARADGAPSPALTTLSTGNCLCQMAAAEARDAAELAELAAARGARHQAAQFRKRSGGALKEYRGKGSNPNSVVFGLAEAAAATYVCQAAGCQALVDAGRARAAAMAKQRANFESGDGCASKLCAKRFRPATFKLRQLARAEALESGARTLRDWPAGVGQGVGQRCGSVAARLAAAAARQQLEQ
jgi:hypothetical protein